MEKDLKTICACKGIRSCLACESAKGEKNCGGSLVEEDSIEYTFCPLCGLCWPNVNSDKEFENFGFHLPGIHLVHDFIGKEEENEIVSNIDEISWVPSQSGRRKQDFGPKVNFKKHKVKIGNFNGFPEFSGFVIDRLASVPSVSSFLPVELCNLEYCPEKGSAIEPHVDDFWLWGERLITLNLLSGTVLTLTPMDSYECSTQCKNKNSVHQDLFYNEDCEHISKELFMSTDSKGCNQLLMQENEENCLTTLVGSCSRHQMTDSKNRSCITPVNNHHTPPENHKNIPKSDSVLCSESDFLKTTSNWKLKRTVKIHLPPRSLLVLYGCARYHWFHAIKRSDIKNRRLAMTFRELSPEFLPGGPQSELGKELLDIAKIQIKS